MQIFPKPGMGSVPGKFWPVSKIRNTQIIFPGYETTTKETIDNNVHIRYVYHIHTYPKINVYQYRNAIEMDKTCTVL